MSYVNFESKKHPLNNALIKGLLTALISMLILVFILTIAFQFTMLSESLLETFGILILVISIIMGAIQAAKTAESRFLLHGFGVGMLYLFFILGVGYFFNYNLLDITFIKKLLYCTVSGLIGGLIGAVMK